MLVPVINEDTSETTVVNLEQPLLCKNCTYTCDRCKVGGCSQCIKTECCDCSIQLCRKCSDVDDLMCDCFGKCYTCGTDVSRGSGWPCNECRIKETQEKRFILSSVPPDLKPHEVNISHGIINVSWPDKHKTVIQLKDIELLRTPRKPKKILWTNNFTPEYFDWDGFLNNDEIAINAISEFISKGAICIKNSPTLSNSLEMLSTRLGPIREVLFERIHNVSIDTHVYNIAHTSLEVPPHNDFASYQAL